jgi:DNA replication protein DnaC
MKRVGDDFNGVTAVSRIRSGCEALPNDGQCPICFYFDASHPDVRRILLDKDPKGRELHIARCKCAREEDLKAARDHFRYGQAQLPAPNRTFDSFNPKPGTADMVDAARRFVGREGPRMLVLVGQTGTGKSHILESIGRQALDAGRTVRYDLTSTFLNRLRHTYDSDAGDDVHTLMNWYYMQDTLLIDDIGLESSTPWVQEQLTTLVSERLNSTRWTAIATNLDKARLADKMGERLASRLYATNPELSEVALVINTAKDYRA